VPVLSLAARKGLDRKLIPAVAAAFDQACSRLSASRSPSVENGRAIVTRVRLASRIIEKASQGEHDINRLADDAIQNLNRDDNPQRRNRGA
jgi:hypothetical protein